MHVRPDGQAAAVVGRRKSYRLPIPVFIFITVLVWWQGFAFGETLEMYSMMNQGEPMQAVLEQIAEDFEEQTGHEVDISWSGREVLNRLRPRLLTGDAPDLVHASVSEMSGALLANDELLLPLNDLLEGEGPEGQESFLDILSEDALRLFEQDGNLYFVPMMTITSGLFYNKTIFDQYGLSVPQTWDELMDVAATLKENGVAPFVQDNIGIYNAYWYYWSAVRGMGPGGLYNAANDCTGATWDEPGYLEAARRIEQISAAGEDYFQNGYRGSTWPAAQTGWGQGNGAMILVGSWIVDEITPLATADWAPGYFPFPVIEEGSPATMEAYANGFAIPEGAANSDIAKEFMRFVLKEEYQHMVAQESRNIPARTGVAFPEGLADVQPYLEQASGFHTVYDDTQAKNPEWFSTIYTPLSTSLVLGDLSAEDFISEIKAQTVRFCER